MNKDAKLYFPVAIQGIFNDVQPPVFKNYQKQPLTPAQKKVRKKNKLSKKARKINRL